MISPEASWLVRRLVAVLVSAWLGGILMVALSAPAAFQSVDFSLKSPPPSMLKAVKLLGEPAVHEILRFQVGEANRLMFETWGTVQLSWALPHSFCCSSSALSGAPRSACRSSCSPWPPS